MIFTALFLSLSSSAFGMRTLCKSTVAATSTSMMDDYGDENSRFPRPTATGMMTMPTGICKETDDYGMEAPEYWPTLTFDSPEPTETADIPEPTEDPIFPEPTEVPNIPEDGTGEATEQDGQDDEPVIPTSSTRRLKRPCPTMTKRKIRPSSFYGKRRN